MKTSEIILIGAAAFIGLNMLSTKVSAYTGEVIGQSAGQVASGSVIGLWQGLWNYPYNWARNYQGNIPIIDPVARVAAYVKNLGNPNIWLG